MIYFLPMGVAKIPSYIVILVVAASVTSSHLSTCWGSHVILSITHLVNNGIFEILLFSKLGSRNERESVEETCQTVGEDSKEANADSLQHVRQCHERAGKEVCGLLV